MLSILHFYLHVHKHSHIYAKKWGNYINYCWPSKLQSAVPKLWAAAPQRSLQKKQKTPPYTIYRIVALRENHTDRGPVGRRELCILKVREPLRWLATFYLDKSSCFQLYKMCLGVLIVIYESQHLVHFRHSMQCVHDLNYLELFWIDFTSWYYYNQIPLLNRGKSTIAFAMDGYNTSPWMRLT